ADSQLVVCFGGRRLHHCEEFIPAFGTGGGTDDRADCLRLTAEKILSRNWRRRCLNRAAIHTPLELAQVLAARDDLLSRVAAFLEIDAADELEIRHLRHEVVLRCERDLCNARAH